MQESPRWRQRCGILWLPREARRRVVRLAFSRPPAIHVGGRRPLRAVAAGSIHSAARLRDRGDARGGTRYLARPAGLADVSLAAGRRFLDGASGDADTDAVSN